MKPGLRFATILSLLVLSGLAVLTAGERRFEKKFAVSAGGTLTLDTDIGSVSVVGTEGNEVSVVVDMEGREKDLKDFEVSASQTENGIRVLGESGRSNWRFWNFNDMDIKYSIGVPREYSLSLNTSGGDIRIRNVKGKVEGGTSGGNLVVNDIEGTVNLETSGGNIRAGKVTGSLQMETSGGNVEIERATGDVDVGTSGGNIRVGEVTGKVRAATSGGSITIAVKGENKGVFAETSGGDIDILVAKNTAATIDASTSGGEVSCDLPITMTGKIDESRIRGSVNGGGNTIHAHTSGGNVRIRAIE